MLFHWLLDRHAGTDVVQVEVEIGEPLDLGRLAAAWQHVISSFGALRTAFRWEGLSEPEQYVEPTCEVPFSFEDLRHLDSGAQSAHVQGYLAEDRREGFDLATAPSMRLALFQLEDARYSMVWSYHHILIDAWAAGRVLSEVHDAYREDPAPRIVDHPYREYIDWVTEEDVEDARAFWKAELAGIESPTPIPTDSGLAGGEGGFDRKRAALSPELAHALHGLAAREGLSPDALLVGAWAFLLSRYAGERDVVFGVAGSTRDCPIRHADSRVGLMLATVPLRVRVEPEATAAHWLREVAHRWRRCQSFRHLPLVDVRAAGGMSVFSSIFDTLVVLNEPGRAPPGGWDHDRGGPRVLGQTSYPLTLRVGGRDGSTLEIEYDKRAFLPSKIERILGHLVTVLEAWAREPDVRLGRTPVLTEEERREILVEWNATSRDYPRGTPLSDFIEEHAARSGERVAVRYREDLLTYRELNARANRLARELRGHGAGPDVIVGLAVERSLDLAVALLAIMKTGAAYVPLDPTFPPERLGYMIEDTRIGILVTQSSVEPRLPPFDGVVLDLDAPTWGANEDTDLGVPMDPDSLAYVIFTSGSTGRPKGVQISRGALANFLWSMQDLLGVSADDRLVAVTTISFDIAALEIWLPLLAGAQTVIVDPPEAAEGSRLRQVLERHDATLLQATPITWRLLLESGWSGKANLRCACGGEAMSPDLATRLAPIVGSLWNLYGPTETTVWSTGFRVRDPGRILIGKPIANTRCYILDEDRAPVPVGAIGELYIAGDGVARGYLNRPELTETKFLPDPFTTDARARMYRTGDLARYVEGGDIECLGRTDDQLKIHGYRIEPGGIEATLIEHRGVRQAVAVARDDPSGTRRLVAYYVPEHEAVEAASLREHLRTSLPEYMVPSAFVTLDRMPLTANGKIDRRALPAPQWSDPSEGGAVSPRTHVEHQLSEIWEELFGVPHVGVTDDFFDMGGHSLLAVRLMGWIWNVFGKRLPLNALFEAPTIAQLAKHIEDEERTDGMHSLVSIQASGSRPPIFWIPGGAALGLFRLRQIVTRLGPDQPVYGLGSSPPPTLDAIPTVEERARSYLELVRRVQPHGPYCFSGFCSGGLVAYEMAQQLVAEGEPVAFVGLINCPFPAYPRTRLDRLAIKGQRSLHQLRSEVATGGSLFAFARRKIAGLRQSRIRSRKRASDERVVRQSGLQRDDPAHNTVLLKATNRVFDRYRPRQYGGKITIFVSEDREFMGVSTGLDARFRWARWAKEFEVCTFTGGHDQLLDEEHVEAFAEALHGALAQALWSFDGPERAAG